MTDSQPTELEKILTKAFNDFYDYITERDMIKVAHEYSEKTVYKTATAQLESYIKEREVQSALDALTQLKVDRMGHVLSTPANEWIREIDFIDQQILESVKESVKEGGVSIVKKLGQYPYITVEVIITGDYLEAWQQLIGGGDE